MTWQPPHTHLGDPLLNFSAPIVRTPFLYEAQNSQGSTVYLMNLSAPETDTPPSPFSPDMYSDGAFAVLAPRGGGDADLGLYLPASSDDADYPVLYTLTLNSLDRVFFTEAPTTIEFDSDGRAFIPLPADKLAIFDSANSNRTYPSTIDILVEPGKPIVVWSPFTIDTPQTRQWLCIGRYSYVRRQTIESELEFEKGKGLPEPIAPGDEPDRTIATAAA